MLEKLAEKGVTALNTEDLQYLDAATKRKYGILDLAEAVEKRKRDGDADDVNNDDNINMPVPMSPRTETVA